MDETLLARAILPGPDAIIAAGRDGVIRFWNAGAERIYGFTEAHDDVPNPRMGRQGPWRPRRRRRKRRAPARDTASTLGCGGSYKMAAQELDMQQQFR